MNGRLALYTTIYPGVERFLSTWYASVFAQTDHDFDLHIGTDRIEPHEVFSALETGLKLCGLPLLIAVLRPRLGKLESTVF